MQTLAAIRDVQRATGRGLSVFLRDVGHGALELGHNTLALVGLALLVAARRGLALDLAPSAGPTCATRPSPWR